MKKAAAISLLCLGCLLAPLSAFSQGIVGIWNFDSPRGFLESAAGEARLQGRATPVAGIVGGGAYFDGREDFLELPLTPENALGEEFTISFWFKAEADSPVYPPLRHTNGYFVANGGPGFSWYDVTGEKGRVYDGYAHPKLLEPGQWHHLALVMDQEAVSLYFDGMLIRSRQGEALGALKAGGSAMIGGHLARVNDQWLNFHGVLDEVSFLNFAKRDWERVQLLLLREKLQALASEISPGASWQEEFRNFSRRAFQCWSDPEAKEILLPEGRRLAREAETLLHGVEGVDFHVRVCSSMERIMPDSLPALQGLPQARMTMAGNERESLQLLVVPDTAREEGTLRVELPRTLTSSTGEEAPFRLSLWQVEYTPLASPSHWMYAYPAVPDKLLAREVFAFGGETPFLPLWLEVISPEEAPAGRYRGEVRFIREDGESLVLPLEVNLQPFSLPRRNIVPSIVGIWERDLQTYLQDGDVAGFKALMTAYADILVEHRLNPSFLHQGDLVAQWVREGVYPDYSLDAAGEAKVNWEFFDELTEHLREKGLSTIVMGPYYRTVEIWKNSVAPEKIWEEVGNHARERGWLEDAVAYPIDEWEIRHLDEINAVGRMVKESSGVRWLMTLGSQNSPLPSIHNVGLWIPQFHWIHLPEARRAQQAGIPVWSYVCTGPQFPVPNFHQDTPAAAVRMVPVANFRFGFDGILHWAANFNTGKNAVPVVEYGAGEGRYVYADERGFPVPTIRLKNFADGMEDWTVLEMLRRRSPKEYRERMTELEALIPGREFEPGMEITASSPREATYHTFMHEEAFYPVISHPEEYLRWRERLYRSLARQK
ncbi:MAG: glycoside hydrolase domain-containing protein [Oligosphaeraceae bacterium]